MVDVGLEATTQKNPWSVDDAICQGNRGVLAPLTTCHRLTNVYNTIEGAVTYIGHHLQVSLLGTFHVVHSLVVLYNLLLY